MAYFFAHIRVIGSFINKFSPWNLTSTIFNFFNFSSASKFKDFFYRNTNNSRINGSVKS